MGERVPVPVDERGVLHAPGELPAPDPAVRQDWDTLRPALRERLSGALGALQMWWRDHDDPHRTSVMAFGEREMCVATPVTDGGRARHRLESRQWVGGSLEQRAFRGSYPGPEPSSRERTEHVPATVGTLPADVRALLGHLPAEVQWYLQVPLLAEGGAAEGMRWYRIWDQPDRKLEAWLWLRAGRAVTFGHGWRVLGGSGPTAVARWDLRCWRASCA